MEPTKETTTEFTNETNTRARTALANLGCVLEQTRNAICDSGIIRETILAQANFNPKADSVPRGHNGNMAVIQQFNSVLTTSFEILTDQTLNFRSRFANHVARGDEKAAKDFLETVEGAILDAKSILRKVGNK
jgi:hypothetical protein